MLTIEVPRVVAGEVKPVVLQVQDQTATCADDPQFGVFVTQNLQLDTGHHADRDLEYAMLIAEWFGGKIKDDRGEN